MHNFQSHPNEVLCKLIRHGGIAEKGGPAILGISWHQRQLLGNKLPV